MMVSLLAQSTVLAFGSLSSEPVVVPQVGPLVTEQIQVESGQESQPAAGTDKLQPGPDTAPGDFEIQFPEIRLTGYAGIASSAEYRDRLVSDASTFAISGSAAARGFSVSGWQSWEMSNRRSSGEFLVGYSFKLPAIDVHTALVVCHNDAFIDGCPEAVRVGFTSNIFTTTTVEVFFDQPLSSGDRSISAGLTHDLWANEVFSSAFRLSATRTTFGSRGDYDGISARLLSSYRLNENISFDIAAGHSWSGGEASPLESSNGFIVISSIVWRQ